MGGDGAREAERGPPSPQPRRKSQKKVPDIQKMPFLVFISYFASDHTHKKRMPPKGHRVQ